MLHTTILELKVYDRAVKKYVDVIAGISLNIDLDAVARRVGGNAVGNKNRTAKFWDGAIVARVTKLENKAT